MQKVKYLIIGLVLATGFSAYGASLFGGILWYDEQAGNLGINVTNPDDTLDVGGNVQITGNLKIATSSCTEALETDSNGVIICGTDATGAGGSSVSDWIKQTTYNILSLTPSTTIPVWLKSNLFASSSAIVDGTVSIGTVSTASKLNVAGRANSALMFSCLIPWVSNTAVTADLLGSATVNPFPCGNQMFFDINTDGTILAQTTLEGTMASGTPLMQSMVAGNAAASGAANSLAVLKSVIVGSATSTGGLAFESWLQTPNVGTVSLSSATTSVSYGFGFSNVTSASISTHDAMFKPTNGVFFVASSTAVWNLVAWRNGVPYIAASTHSTSTTPFKALLVVDGVNGANVYINDSAVSAATIPYANLPTVYIRAFIGVARSAAGTPAFAKLNVGRFKVWGGTY
jgi:hypothetical protein